MSERVGAASESKVDPDWSHDQMVDASDMRCPLPVLKARKRLLAMTTGDRLLVVATDPMSAIDIPHYCQESGNVLVADDRISETFRYLIRKA